EEHEEDGAERPPDEVLPQVAEEATHAILLGQVFWDLPAQERHVGKFDAQLHDSSSSDLPSSLDFFDFSFSDRSRRSHVAIDTSKLRLLSCGDSERTLSFSVRMIRCG